MIKKLIYFSVFISLISCTEKVNLKLDETYTRLVVDGFITDKITPGRVILTKSSDYFYNAPPPKVVNAQVTVSDGTGTWTLAETVPGASGIYQTPEDFSGVDGKTYTLNVNLQEPISGRSTFQSSCKLMKVSKLDSIKAVFEPTWGRKGFWQVRIYAKDPPETNYYMLNLYRNGKLWSDSISKVTVSDDQFFNGNYIDGANGFLISEENSQRLVKGDTIRVELSAITKEYFNFIQQVQQAGFNIPFFTGPPANVQGNINNGGIGFFAAYSSSFASTVVK